MQVNRRDFLKAGSAGAGAMLLYYGLGPKNKLDSYLSSSGKRAMLYDANKCVGCRACQSACKSWNKLREESVGYGGIYENPGSLSGTTWTLIKARELGLNGTNRLFFRKYQCFHCTEASCEAVCPVAAISHNNEAVVINQKLCIGCGYCVQACPFDVAHRDEETGTSRKCTLCVDRTSKGLNPACVEACPAEAVIWGDRSEFIAEGKRRVQSLVASGWEKATLYGENGLGGLTVLYVLPESASVFGLPEFPRMATHNVWGQWVSGVIAAGAIAAIPFWLLFKKKSKSTH